MESVAVQSGQPVAPDALFVDRPANIDAGFESLEAAVADITLVHRLARRPLGDCVDDPADIVFSVQHGRRTFEHLDPLHAVWLDLETREADRSLIEAITEEHGGAEIKATDKALVEPVVETPGRRDNSSRVSDRILELRRPAILKFLLRDHGNRLRNFHKRRVRLGTCRGVPSNVTVAWPYRAAGPTAFNDDGVEFDDLGIGGMGG